MDSFSVPTDPTKKFDVLYNYLCDIQSWVASNFVKLNTDKTELLLITSLMQRSQVSSVVVSICGSSFYPSDNACDLGVIVDSVLSFEAYINHVIKVSYYCLWNLARLRPMLFLVHLLKL